MGLRREVHDGVDLVVFHDQGDEFDVEDVSLNENEVRAVEGRLKVFDVRTVVKDIQTDKMDIGVLFCEEIANMRADETSTAGQEDRLGLVFFRHLKSDMVVSKRRTFPIPLFERSL